MADSDLSPHLPAPSEDPQAWAELAELVLLLAREIRVAGYRDRTAVALSEPEGGVMRFLHGSGPAAPSQIAAATGLQRTNLSAALRALEAKGLVERQASDQDRRSVLVRRTALGVSNFALVRREWGELLANAAGPERAEPQAAVELLRRLACGLAQRRRDES